MRLFACLLAALAACSQSAQNSSSEQVQQAVPAGNSQEASLEGQPDVVASYRMNGPDGSQVATMTVEANDSGAARIEMRFVNAATPAQVGWATESGDVVMTANTPEGPRLVRASDMAAVSEEMMTRMAPPGGMPANPFGTMRLEATGDETIGGRTGTRYVVRGDAERAGSGDQGMDFVIANDPSLALIGRATSHTLAPSTAAGGRFTPPAFRELRQRMRSGAALRVGRTLTLESVDCRPIDPSRLVVEGTPVPREELRQLMLRALPPPPIIRAPRPPPEASPQPDRQ